MLDYLHESIHVWWIAQHVGKCDHTDIGILF